MRTRVKSRGKWKRVLAVTLGVLLVLLLAAGFVGWRILAKGQESLRAEGEYQKQAEDLPDPTTRIFSDGFGLYRDELINILCLGIDGRGEAEENDSYGFGPKADAIYLAVLDTGQHTMTLLNISRDSVTPIRGYDSNGQEVGLYDWQLGLQYTMGNGLDTSCELMEEAVSRMLGGIPIHAYCALYWSGVEALAEEAGSVTVTVTEEMHELDQVHFPETGEIELTPEQAKIYVQGRDITVTGSNEIRAERQKMYLKAMYSKLEARIRKNPLELFALKETVEPYLVTDLTTEEILTLAVEAAQLSGEPEIVSVPGEAVATRFQDEYQIDEDGLEELIEEIFYRDIKAEEP